MAKLEVDSILIRRIQIAGFTSYDCRLPDFGLRKGAYCIAIGEDGADKPRALRCGGKLGMNDFSIPPQPQPPHLTIGDKADRDRILSWDGAGQVFELNFGHDFLGLFVRVYTSKRSFAWSELVCVIGPTLSRSTCGRPACSYPVPSGGTPRRVRDTSSTR